MPSAPPPTLRAIPRRSDSRASRVRRVRDEEFSSYVAQRRPQLYRTAYLLCGDPHRAEDIVQQALAKLYTSWARVRRADSVDAYARRTVVNSFRDDLGRPWRRERPHEDLSVLTVLDRGRISVPQGLSHEDELALWAAIRGLAPGQRRVVVLRHLWGLSVEETAGDLGISPGTVKSQTSDALARLRIALTTPDTVPDSTPTGTPTGTPTSSGDPR